MKKLIFFIQIILVLFFVSTVKAAECSVAGQCYCRFYPDGQAGAVGGNVTMSTSCAIYGDVDGVVAGNLTILPNTTITLHKTLVFSPGYSVNVQTGGIIYINTGGMMKQGQICVKDNDNDGYAETKILDKDPYGVALEIPITQIDQIFSEGSCSAPYRLRANMNDLTMVDNDPNSTDVTRLSTSDREMLRLGFDLNGITDVEAGTGDVQIIDKNLLVCTSTGCPATTFNPLKGNLYVASKVGIGITSPTYPLDVTGNTRLTGTLNVSSTVTAPTFSGNATTATTLQTARTIWGQSFNGSANVSGALSGATTGSFSSTVTAPTFSGALSGNATTASYATSSNYLSNNYVGGVQLNPQTYFNNTIGLKVAMTGYPNTWSDTLWINGYAGGDVPNMIALHTIRNGQPRMWLSSQASTSTSFGTAYEFITSWNIASQTVSNSDMTDGLHVASGRNNAANQIVRTDANGYIQAGYINSSNGDENNAASPAKVWGTGSSDGYMRTYQTGYLNVNYANSAGTATNVSGGTASASNYNLIGAPGSFALSVGNADGGSLAGATADFKTWYGFGIIGMAGNPYGNGTRTIAFDGRSGGIAIRGSLSAGGTVSASSDVRLKTNIRPLPDNILEKVNKLRGVYFNWKPETHKGKANQIGVIAQEVEKLFPEIVVTEPDGYKSVDYSRFSPILIEAIKEQQAEIDSLKQQVTDLNQRLIELENKLK